MSVLSDQLEIWGFEGDTVIFSDSSFGFGLNCSQLDVSCADDNKISEITEQVRSFLNSIPASVDVQFCVSISSNNEEFLQKFNSLKKGNVSLVATELHNQKNEFLNSSDFKENLVNPILKLFVRRTPLNKLLDKPKLFSKTQKFEEISEQKLIAELKETENLKEDILSSLKTLGITGIQIPQKELVELIYLQWNPGRQVEIAGYDPEDIRSSVLFSDVAIEQKGFVIGGVEHRVISLKNLPENTFSCMSECLQYLPSGAEVFLTVKIPNQQQEIEKLKLDRRVAFSMLSSKKGVSDIESNAKFQDVEALLNEMIASNEKVFRVSLNIVLKSESSESEKLEKDIRETLSTIRTMAGSEAMEESVAAFDVFKEIAIPNAHATERSKRMKTSNAADFLPIYGPWKGHDECRVILFGNNSLISFDPFAKEHSNYNQIVTGGSGSGKSFLTNVLLLQCLRENPKVFIVDIGGSYKKLCDNLDGQYIPISLDAGISLNPFDLPAGENRPSNHKIKFLLGLIEIMTKEDFQTHLSRLERAQIEDLIIGLYEKHKNPRLSNLRGELLNSDDLNLIRIGKILNSWCGATPFGQIIDQETKVSLNKNLISFDLKGLEAYPDLQSVFLYLITDLVWREVQKDKSTMKFLVLDECWKLLESGSGSVFIGEVFRTFRKYYASAIAISQNIDDFAKSSVSQAILPNSSIKWVLMQKGSDKKRLKEVLNLNDKEIEHISSLKQERGQYSETFLMAEDKHIVARICPTPLEYWIATTDPRDTSKIESLRKEKPELSQLETLKTLAEEYPCGVVGGIN